MHILLKVLLGGGAAYGAYKVVQSIATPAQPAQPAFVPAPYVPAAYVPPPPPPSPHVDIVVPQRVEPGFIGPLPAPSPGMHISVDPGGINPGVTDNPAVPGDSPGWATNEEE